jgi:hypothetical protein
VTDISSNLAEDRVVRDVLLAAVQRADAAEMNTEDELRRYLLAALEYAGMWREQRNRAAALRRYV